MSTRRVPKEVRAWARETAQKLFKRGATQETVWRACVAGQKRFPKATGLVQLVYLFMWRLAILKQANAASMARKGKSRNVRPTKRRSTPGQRR